MVSIREARPEDDDAIWTILEPMIRLGDTYALPRSLSRDEALAYWRGPGNSVFVAEEGGVILGTYILRANQQGGGSHVSNCGYVTAPFANGRGIANAMCRDSLARAAAAGFRAMQFNFVVSTNDRAVNLWKRNGFAIVGTLPDAFLQSDTWLCGCVCHVPIFVMYPANSDEDGRSRFHARSPNGDESAAFR